MAEYDAVFEQRFAELVQKLSILKAQQKALSNDEALLKEELMGMMSVIDSSSEETDFGTVRIQRRSEKDYGREISTAEILLKERKKLADDLGDYEVVAIKESLVFTPAKDPF